MACAVHKTPQGDIYWLRGIIYVVLDDFLNLSFEVVPTFTSATLQFLDQLVRHVENNYLFGIIGLLIIRP